MIRTLAITKDLDLLYDPPLDQLKEPHIHWFWMDFECPTEDEIALLETYFAFHPLAIEDCLQFLQRPKLEYYDTYNFFVIHALNGDKMEATEVDIFLSEKYVVSFHLKKSHEIDTAWKSFIDNKNFYDIGPVYATYLIMDKIVDQYFPLVYQIEDRISELDDNIKNYSVKSLMDKVFDVRGSLLKIRHTIISMRDLLYRILSSSHLKDLKEQQLYFNDVYDHLLKLSQMIDSNLEITADMRDSYLAMNANRMNSVMMLLTVMTTIFIPLTFIAGIYGMNFKYMPELEWRYGYFFVLALMGSIGILMFYWFKRKGWFDLDK